MEAICPSSCLTPTLHVLCHVWDDVDWFGSVQGTWCFPWERWMRFMRAHIKSAAFPIKNYLNQHLLCARLDLAAVRLFEKRQISPSDQYGYTANFRRGLNPKTHFLRLDGIGGRVVLADHPEQDTKKVILDIDRLEYPEPEK